MAWNYVATHRRRRFSSGISDLEDQEAEGQATKDKKGEKEGKMGGKKKGTKQCPKKPVWMKNPPPAAQKNKPNFFNGNTYWWCSKHNSWGGHKEHKCEGSGLEKKIKVDPEAMATIPLCTTINLNNALSTILEDK